MSPCHFVGAPMFSHSPLYIYTHIFFIFSALETLQKYGGGGAGLRVHLPYFGDMFAKNESKLENGKNVFICAVSGRF